MKKALTRVVSWGHELLAEVVSAGDLVVDLTAGNGYDALFLAQLVADSGQVVAFDIQPAALKNARKRLQEEGFSPRLHCSERKTRLLREVGIDLVLAGHERLADYLPAPPQAVLANLGYLPGGDHLLITRQESTLQALLQASQLLKTGGRMAVVVYVGHPGGVEEGQAVQSFFSTLDNDCFQVLQLAVANRPQAPYLLVAEKIC